ncbi:ParA family protein [Synechococcus elongatus]|uniref:ParA family protein n=1 Tax=Synechococcus elongatus TaxID=32046 RepID=UPI0030CCCD24
MLTVTCASLSGGQGKTTSALFLGRSLAAQGQRVLMIDADPQSSLSFYLGCELSPDQPTLLEVLKKEIDVVDSLWAVDDRLTLIPADDALDSAQDFLATSGMGAIVLRRRLLPLQDRFDFCVIDAPPQRSQLCMTSVGAADQLLIPAEASSKGLNSLLRTLDLVAEMSEVEAFQGQILGVLPFRDRWLGRTQAKQSQKSLESMQEVAAGHPILPSILESEQFKKAIDQGVSLAALGYADLEYPFRTILEKLGCE